MPSYSLQYKGIAVVNKSKLGLTIAKGASFLNWFTIKLKNESSFNENWNPVLGEVKTINNHYNELEVELNQPAYQRSLIIRFRVFNDGLGFRYEFPHWRRYAA